MIIECGHCGAPLDVKANEKASKCAYCGTSNQVRTQRTIAFETPAGWRPPPQWTPPPHFAANSQQVLMYRAVGKGIGLIVGISVFGVLVTVGAIVGAVVLGATTAANEASRVQEEVERATRQANDAISQAIAQASAAQDQAQQALSGVPGVTGPSLLTSQGVQNVFEAYKQAAGTKTLKLKRLVLHDTHSSAQVQSVRDNTQLDGYSYDPRGVDGPHPERLHGSEKSNLEDFLFDPEKTALTRIETLKQATLRELALEEAKITHVVAERRNRKVEILVYGGSARESGYVAFDDKGKVIRVAK
jgi:hypothetical protein